MPFQINNKHARGGKRVGAGRKLNAAKEIVLRSKPLSAEAVVSYLDEMRKMAFSKEVPAKVRADLLIYLTNRVIGHPTQRRETSGPDGGPIERVEWPYELADCNPLHERSNGD